MYQEYEEEYNGTGTFGGDEKRKHRKGCLFAIISAIAIVIIFLLLMYKTAIPVDHRKFSYELKKKIEQEYMISLDHAEPVRYWVPALAQDMNSRFDFYTDDYKYFMENDFHGEAVLNSYEEPDGSSARYRCHAADTRYFELNFTREKKRYKGELTCYRDSFDYSAASGQ